MPTNLTKMYNSLLEFLYQNHQQNIQSFRAVFNRDFSNTVPVIWRSLPVLPTPADGEDVMDRQFRHLTTVITDEKTRKREFESERTVRIHWIRHHLEEKSPEHLLVFKVTQENRVYVLDKTERYVVIMEPYRKADAFYLLTAYRLLPANFKKMMKKYEKTGTPL